MGQQWRCVALTPQEARKLARALRDKADEAEHIKGQVAGAGAAANGAGAVEATKAQIGATFGGPL